MWNWRPDSQAETGPGLILASSGCGCPQDFCGTKPQKCHCKVWPRIESRSSGGSCCNMLAGEGLAGLGGGRWAEK